MAEAARLGDQITHSFALAGVIAGAVAGAAILAVSVAVIGISVLTFGLGGVLAAVVGAAVVGGALSGGAAIGKELGSMAEVPCGGIAPACSPNVFVNVRNAARTELDFGACSGPPPIGPAHPYPASILAEGSATVFVNQQHAVRKGERTACDAKVSTGSGDVFIGGPSVQTRPIDSEVPGWVDDLILYTGIASALILLPLAPGAIIGGLVGGTLLGMGGSALGGAIFGEGSKGQRLMGLAGSLLGGGIGARAGAGMQKGLASRLCNTRGDRLGKFYGGEPVDVITGEVFTDEVDFELPWRIPVTWRRFYSSQRQRRGIVGWGWESLADARLQIMEDGSVDFWDGKIAPVSFPYLPWNGDRVTENFEGATLVTHLRTVEVQTRNGLRYEFPRPTADERECELLSITDPSGNSVFFDRPKGVLCEISSSCGPWLELKSKDGLLKQVILHHPAHPSRVLVSYEHSEEAELIANLDPLGNRHTYQYLGRRLIQHANRNGVAFRYEYADASPDARCIRTWGGAGLYDYQFNNDPLRRRTSYRDSRGGEWIADYDEFNFLVAQTDPNGATTHYQYDEHAHVSAVIDPLGRRTDYQYDELGNLRKLTRPDGGFLLYQYDHRNCLTQLTDAAGHIWKQEWDGKRRLAKRITPMGHTHEYSYNERGDLTAHRSPRGATTRFERDPYSDAVIGSMDPLGHHVSWHLDPLGRVTRYVDQVGAITDYDLDEKGRVTCITRPTGVEVHCGYDREMNLTEYRDELGHVTRFDYCGLNELAARHLPDGSAVRYEYDTEERLTAVINGRGERYRLDRDPAGRVIRRVDYWGAATELRRNAAGEVIERLDPLKRLTTYERDALGRLRTRAYDDGTAERFTYDPLGNLVEFHNADARVAREFDAESQLLWETQNDFKVEYSYDPAGNCVRRTSTVGNVVEYGYDAADRFVALKVNGASLLAIERDPRGLAVHESLGESLARTHEYDAEWRTTQQQLTGPTGVIIGREYRYDPAGRLRQRSEATGPTDTFDYDPVGRLVRHRDPEGAIREFLRDAAGDFLRPEAVEAGEPPPTDPHTEPAHRRGAEFNGKRYRFDDAGNIIEIRARHERMRLYWNGENRLTKARTPSGAVAHYSYDAVGRRTGKTLSGFITQFGWDGDVSMAENYGGKWREYVHHPYSFEPIAIVSDEGTDVFFNDMNGAPCRVVALGGEIRWEAICQSWGGVEVSRESTIENPIRLQGQYYDRETGLHYNRRRYYTPELGAFLTQDPAEFAAGVDLYRMANDVYSWIDPLGLACKADYTQQSREHVSSHGHAANSPAQSGKSRFRVTEGGQKFTDEVMNHPNVQTTPQGNGRIKYEVQDLGRVTGTGQQGQPVRGGTVIVEGQNPQPWSTYSPDEVVTQFPR